MIKKITALVLTCILLLGYAPMELLANPQSPVSDLQLTDMTKDGDVTYKIDLHWSNPTNGDPNGSPLDPNASHSVIGYDLYYRNATRGLAYTDPYREVPHKAGTTDYTDGFEQPLDIGSLYFFKAEAFHVHMVETSTGELSQSRVVGKSVNDALYLTDLAVTAQGAGENLTVTWSNPTLEGKDLFTGYRIYYGEGGKELTSIKNSKYVTVDINNVSLTKTNEGLWQYVIHDETLLVGRYYAVAVEPLYNGKELRGTSPIKQVTYNNRVINITYTSREYRTNEAYIEFEIVPVVEDSETLRLTWNKLKNTANTVDRVEILRSTSGDESEPWQTIGTLYGKSASDINFWLTNMPDSTAYYKLNVFYVDIDTPMSSKIAEFNPTLADFIPYSPVITEITDSQKKPFSLNITWEAFLREPYNDSERQNVDPDTKKYIDKDLLYYIWVTDDLSNFSSLTDLDVALQPQVIDLTEIPYKESGVTTKFLYSTTVTTYTSVSGGVRTQTSLEDNKVYYVKIIAKRTENLETSQEAYGNHFIQPVENLFTDPNMIAMPPLRVTDVQSNSITINWDSRWFEIYNPDDERWYSKVGVDSDGDPVYGSACDEIADSRDVIQLNKIDYIANLSNSTSVASRIVDIKEDIESIIGLDPDTTAVRYIDLGSSYYEIHTVKNELMVSYGGYEEYLDYLIAEGNGGLWQTINPQGNPPQLTYTITEENAPTKAALNQNTPYVIFLRPYLIKDTKKSSYYPSYVTATTLDTRIPVDITPTVPILLVESATDTTIVVKWEVSNELEYILKYDELLKNYPNGGTTFSYADIKKSGYSKEDTDGTLYYYFTITNLFPNTPYYIWIYSTAATSAGGIASSAASNPAYGTTLDIVTPQPPRGLGLASQDNLTTYNRVQGKGTEGNPKIEQSTAKYIVVEWMRDYYDTDAPAAITNGAAYEVIFDNSFSTSYLVKSNVPKPNKAYYFRVQTVLTVTRNAKGEVAKNYTYNLQFSEDPNFSDFKNSTGYPIPGINKDSSSATDFIQRTSDWSEVIKLFSSIASGEYDDDINPNLYPLPVDDFEIIYDSATDTLSYRFRSNGVDANGIADGSVDQRFIGRLLSQNEPVYAVDLTKYNNKLVANRTVEFPYSIMKAFDDQQILLRLTADNITVTLAPGSLQTAEMTSLPDYGTKASVKMSFTQNATDNPALGTNASYESTPKKLTISVATPTRAVSLNTLSKNMNVSMKLNHRFSVMDSNTTAYQVNKSTMNWERAQGKTDLLAGTINFETNKITNYAVISKAATLPTDESPNSLEVSAAQNVSTHLEITDIGQYSSSTPISANQLNQIIAAVANNSPTVSINDPLSPANTTALSRSQLLMGGSSVSRETGVHALVRLYELKTKKAVSTNGLQPTGDMVGSMYQTNLLKASKLGFFTGSSVDPQGVLTIGDTLRFVDIIMADSGYY